MVASNTGSGQQQPSLIPHDTPEENVWASSEANHNGQHPSNTRGPSYNDEDHSQEGEHSPLLGAAQIPSESQPESAADPTSIYVKILEEHLPPLKRPSALWLLPVFALSSITGGMLISSIGQFMTLNLCQEYLNNHPSSNSTMMAMLPPQEMCRGAEIQAYTAKTLAIVEVLGAVTGKELCATFFQDGREIWSAHPFLHAEIQL